MKIKHYLQAPEGNEVVGTAPAVAPAAPVVPAATEIVPASNDDGGSTLSPEAVEDLLKDDFVEDTGGTPDAPIVVAPASPAAPAVVAPAPAAAPPVAPIVAPAPAPVVAPVVAPAVPPAVAPVPAAVATVPPVAPVVPAPVVAAPEKTQEQLNQEAATRRQEFRARLVEVYTAPLKDKGALLLTEPEKALPELAAELHQNVLESAIHGIMSQVPMIVQNILANQRVTESNEVAFFQAWPQLAEKRGDAMPLITRFAPLYRQANPTASLQDFIREVGSMTMVALRIPPKGHEAPIVAVAPSAFAPAVPGAGGAPPAAAPGPKNQWEALQEEFLQDDRSPN